MEDEFTLTRRRRTARTAVIKSQDETDIDKVNVQWQIVHLEVAIAEKEEQMKEVTEEKTG